MTASFSSLPAELRQDVLLRIVESSTSIRDATWQNGRYSTMSRNLRHALHKLVRVDRQTAADMELVAIAATKRAVRDKGRLHAMEQTETRCTEADVGSYFSFRRGRVGWVKKTEQGAKLVWQIRNCEKDIKLFKDAEKEGRRMSKGADSVRRGLLRVPVPPGEDVDMSIGR